MCFPATAHDLTTRSRTTHFHIKHCPAHASPFHTMHGCKSISFITSNMFHSMATSRVLSLVFALLGVVSICSASRGLLTADFEAYAADHGTSGSFGGQGIGYGGSAHEGMYGGGPYGPGGDQETNNGGAATGVNTGGNNGYGGWEEHGVGFNGGSSGDRYGNGGYDGGGGAHAGSHGGGGDDGFGGYGAHRASGGGADGEHHSGCSGGSGGGGGEPGGSYNGGTIGGSGSYDAQEGPSVEGLGRDTGLAMVAMEVEELVAA